MGADDDPYLPGQRGGREEATGRILEADRLYPRLGRVAEGREVTSRQRIHGAAASDLGQMDVTPAARDGSEHGSRRDDVLADAQGRREVDVLKPSVSGCLDDPRSPSTSITVPETTG